MSDFEAALEQVKSEEPVSTPAVPEVTGNEGATSPTPTDDELPASVKDYLAKNPQYEEAVRVVEREMKSAFTPRLQEAAELRKQYEGLDPNVAAAVRHLQQLITDDPRNAAEYLRQQAQLLEGAQNPQAQPDPANTDPFSQYEPATEVEALLLREVQAMKQWQQQQTSQFHQQAQQQKAVTVQQEFGKLEQEFGVQVPIEERARAWELSEATQGKLTVTDAYFALNRNTLLPTLTQKARDEASGVVQQKMGMSVPGSLATRGGAPQVEGPQDFDHYWREAVGG
jgi:hypothetical protein